MILSLNIKLILISSKIVIWQAYNKIPFFTKGVFKQFLTIQTTCLVTAVLNSSDIQLSNSNTGCELICIHKFDWIPKKCVRIGGHNDSSNPLKIGGSGKSVLYYTGWVSFVPRRRATGQVDDSRHCGKCETVCHSGSLHCVCKPDCPKLFLKSHVAVSPHTLVMHSQFSEVPLALYKMGFGLWVGCSLGKISKHDIICCHASRWEDTLMQIANGVSAGWKYWTPELQEMCYWNHSDVVSWSWACLPATTNFETTLSCKSDEKCYLLQI